jgi:hypothetical protein
MKVRPGRVVYVAAEAGRSILNRVAAWARKKHDERSAVDFFAIPSPVDLCHFGKAKDGGDVARLVEAIGAADVVVIDTVSRALSGGDENAPDDMGAFVNALDRLRDALGATVIAVHHVGKDASRGGRGHSLLHCAVDTEIEVKKDEKKGVTVATVTKQRDAPGGQQIGFKLNQVELGKDEDGDPVTSCVVEAVDYVPEPKPARNQKAQELSGYAKAALEILNAEIAEKGEWRPAFNDEMRMMAMPVWRQLAEASGRLGDNFRTNWSRALDKLLEAEKVWIEGPRETGYAYPLD